MNNYSINFYFWRSLVCTALFKSSSPTLVPLFTLVSLDSTHAINQEMEWSDSNLSFPLPSTPPHSSSIVLDSPGDDLVEEITTICRIPHQMPSPVMKISVLLRPFPLLQCLSWFQRGIHGFDSSISMPSAGVNNVPSLTPFFSCPIICSSFTHSLPIVF